MTGLAWVAVQSGVWGGYEAHEKLGHPIDRRPGVFVLGHGFVLGVEDS